MSQKTVCDFCGRIIEKQLEGEGKLKREAIVNDGFRRAFIDIEVSTTMHSHEDICEKCLVEAVQKAFKL